MPGPLAPRAVNTSSLTASELGGILASVFGAILMSVFICFCFLGGRSSSSLARSTAPSESAAEQPVLLEWPVRRPEAVYVAPYVEADEEQQQQQQMLFEQQQQQQMCFEQPVPSSGVQFAWREEHVQQYR